MFKSMESSDPSEMKRKAGHIFLFNSYRDVQSGGCVAQVRVTSLKNVLTDSNLLLVVSVTFDP